MSKDRYVKPVSRDWDEFCYPFIYEQSYLWFWDSVGRTLLSSWVGAVFGIGASGSRDTATPAAEHLSLEWFCAWEISHHRVWIGRAQARLSSHSRSARRWFSRNFVLPGGHRVSVGFILCRCQAKKVVRALVSIEHHEAKNRQTRFFFKYANLVANTLYALASFTNHVNEVKGSGVL